MQRKVQAGGLGGAVTVVIVWLLGAIANVDVPAEVASAFTVIISTGIGYAVREPK
jgi:putative flippase GtrA